MEPSKIIWKLLGLLHMRALLFQHHHIHLDHRNRPQLTKSAFETFGMSAMKQLAALTCPQKKMDFYFTSWNYLVNG
jgi:hypothetical protein